MTNDRQIEKLVREELKFESGINHADIEVLVNNGVVTLTGHVSSHLEKMYAENAAGRVKGVVSVIDHTDIMIPRTFQRSDDHIQAAVERLIRWNCGIEDDRVHVEVKDGLVKLSGEVMWEYQKTRAKSLAEDVTGVMGVENKIRVTSQQAA